MMSGERHPTAVRQSRWTRSCLALPAVCAIALMACVLGGALPELGGQLGDYQVVAYTTRVPTCSPAAPCRQQFADVPLPHYYVIWVIPRDATCGQGKRLLTIPLTPFRSLNV